MFAALTIILLIRLVSLHFNTTALFFDEAQYWLWGKEPDFGYFSKPPLLGWTIGLFTYVCGSDSEFCVRLASPILHTGTAFLIFLAATHLFDEKTGFWAAIIYATLPGITLSSTLISTDVPLLLCWSGALWAFVRLHQHNNWSNALLLGFFIGAGLMAKYAMAYFFLCACLYAWVEKDGRKIVFKRKFLTASGVAMLILSPNLWWNLQHKFITASHTSDNIGWRGGVHFDKAAEFVASQFGVFGPILFAIFLIALVRFVIEGLSRQQKLLVMFSFPVLVLIIFQALMSKAYANWAALTYVAATILVSDILVNRIPAFWHRASLFVHLFLFGALAVGVAYSAPGYLTLPNGREPFARLHGWREIAQASEGLLDDKKYAAVLGAHRHLTAELIYYLRNRPERVFAFHQSGQPNDHYELTRPYRGKPQGPVLLVSTSQNITKFAPFFNLISPVGTYEPSSGNIRKLWFFSLDGYRFGDGKNMSTLMQINPQRGDK